MDRSPRIDFYVTDDPAPEAASRLVCRIAEKGWRAGYRIHIHAGAASRAEEMDRLLWSFRGGGFVPHEPDRAGVDALTPIRIGVDEPCWDADVLINLSDEPPPFFNRFKRLVEVIDADGKAAGRRRFRFYVEHGCAPETHRVDQLERGGADV